MLWTLDSMIGNTMLRRKRSVMLRGFIEIKYSQNKFLFKADLQVIFLLFLFFITLNCYNERTIQIETIFDIL